MFFRKDLKEILKEKWPRFPYISACPSPRVGENIQKRLQKRLQNHLQKRGVVLQRLRYGTGTGPAYGTGPAFVLQRLRYGAQPEPWNGVASASAARQWLFRWSWLFSRSRAKVGCADLSPNAIKTFTYQCMKRVLHSSVATSLSIKEHVNILKYGNGTNRCASTVELNRN